MVLYIPGDTILITDVGDSFYTDDYYNPPDPGPSLVCVTSNVITYCCRGGDHPGSGSVGNWLFPNGTIVIGNNANPNGDFIRSSHNQQIRLNRKRSDVISPTGVYTCEVPDESNTAMLHKANITLGEYNYYRYYRAHLPVVCLPNYICNLICNPEFRSSAHLKSSPFLISSLATDTYSRYNMYMWLILMYMLGYQEL